MAGKNAWSYLWSVLIYFFVVVRKNTVTSINIDSAHYTIFTTLHHLCDIVSFTLHHKMVLTLQGVRSWLYRECGSDFTGSADLTLQGVRISCRSRWRIHIWGPDGLHWWGAHGVCVEWSPCLSVGHYGSCNQVKKPHGLCFLSPGYTSHNPGFNASLTNTVGLKQWYRKTCT